VFLQSSIGFSVLAELNWGFPVLAELNLAVGRSLQCEGP
jgi:hypothetical protein